MSVSVSGQVRVGEHVGGSVQVGVGGNIALQFMDIALSYDTV